MESIEFIKAIKPLASKVFEVIFNKKFNEVRKKIISEKSMVKIDENVLKKIEKNCLDEFTQEKIKEYTMRDEDLLDFRKSLISEENRNRFIDSFFEQNKEFRYSNKNIITDCLNEYLDVIDKILKELLTDEGIILYKEIERLRAESNTGIKEIKENNSRILEILTTIMNNHTEEIAMGNQNESEMQIKEQKSYKIPLENKLFIGRRDKVGEIFHYLYDNEKVVLTGLSGIGKTQIAKRYLHLNKSKYDLICWIEACNIEDLNNEYYRMYCSFNLGADKVIKDIDIIKEKVKEYISTFNKSLIIFDNANEIDFGVLREHFPSGESDIIVTTQNSTYDGSYFKEIKVNNLDPLDGQALLINNTDKRNPAKSDKEDIEELVRMLSSYPLALEHARAYINKLKISVRDYINLYNENRIEIMGNELTEYHSTILTTYRIILKKISSLNCGCILFLNKCAFLYSHNIPINELFIDTKLYSTIDLYNIIDSLMSYSLVEIENSNMLYIHGIIQEYIKNDLRNENKYNETIIETLELIYRRLSIEIQNEESKNICELVIPHAVNISNIACNNDIGVILNLKVLNKIANVFYKFGKYKEALIYYKKILLTSENVELEKYIYTLNFEAMCYHYLKTRGALEKALKAIDIFHEKEEELKKYIKKELIERLACVLYGNTGIILKDSFRYNSSNKLNDSLKYFKEALKYAVLLNDSDLKSRQYCNIGNIYKHKGELENSMRNFENALECARENASSKEMEARALGSIGDIYKENKKFLEAYNFTCEALKIARDIGDRRSQVICLDCIGVCLIKLDNSEIVEDNCKLALINLNESLQISREIHYKEGEMFILSHMGNCYFKMKNNQAARKNYKDSLVISKEIGYKRIINCNIDKLNLVNLIK